MNNANPSRKTAAVEGNLTEASSELVAEIGRLRTELEQNGFTPEAQASLTNVETMATALKDVVPGP